MSWRLENKFLSSRVLWPLPCLDSGQCCARCPVPKHTMQKILLPSLDDRWSHGGWDVQWRSDPCWGRLCPTVLMVWWMASVMDVQGGLPGGTTSLLIGYMISVMDVLMVSGSDKTLWIPGDLPASWSHKLSVIYHRSFTGRSWAGTWNYVEDCRPWLTRWHVKPCVGNKKTDYTLYNTYLIYIYIIHIDIWLFTRFWRTVITWKRERVAMFKTQIVTVAHRHLGVAAILLKVYNF